MKVEVDDSNRLRDDLWFEIERAMRYHQRRRAHYEFLHKAAMFSIIVLGSAAFQASVPFSSSFGLVAAIIAAADLVVGFSYKARDHYALYKDFAKLAQDISTAQAPFSEKLPEWRLRRMEIELEEPPVYWALEASCYNEVLHAWDWDKSQAVQIPLWHKIFMHWWRFENFGMGCGDSPGKAPAQ